MFNRKTRTEGLPVTFKWFALFLFILAILVYYPVLDDFFLGDDGGWIYRAILLKFQPRSILQPIAGKYRPLIFVVFLAEYELFKLNPFYYHLVSLTVHYMNILLVFAFIRLLLHNTGYKNSDAIAFMCSFLFAFSFMNYEALFWISLVHDLLNAFFYLLSLIFFIQFYKTQDIKRYGLSFFCYMMCILSKEIGIMIPVILSLCLFLIFNERRKTYYMYLLPYAAVPSLFMAFYFFSGTGLDEFSFGLSPFIVTSLHLKEAALSFFGFSQNIALNAMTSDPFLFALKRALNILVFLFLTPVFLSLLYGIRKKNIQPELILKMLIFCPAWCVITFLPYSFLSWLSFWKWLPFSPGYHYFYISMIGIALFAAFILSSVREQYRHTRFFSLSAGVAAGCLLCLFLSNIIPMRFMERGYAYQGEVLKHLLTTIRRASSLKKKANSLFLANFPQEYDDLHEHGLAGYIKLMGIPVENRIEWIGVKQLKFSACRGEETLCLQYRRPFLIDIK